MEFLAILLSGLLALVSPAGLVLDRTAENAIRSRFESVEQLQVRVDNTPSYQILQGKVERVRIAGRGLFPVKDIRIDTLEVETDPLEIDPHSLRQGRPKLEKPVQAGVRLVLKPEDINEALRSPLVTARLKNLAGSLVGSSPVTQQVQRYQLLDPRVEFLPNNRLRLQATLQEANDPEKLAVTVESGLGIMAGQQLQLIDPAVLVNGQAAPSELATALASGISNRFNLRNLEASGLTVRLLKLDIYPSQLELAGFVKVDPKLTASRK